MSAPTARITAIDPGRARFESAYAAHAPAVLGYLARRVEEPADAADLLAEVFLVAWRRRADLPDGGGVRPWLFVVARNQLADHRRSGGRRNRLAGALGLAVGAAVQASAEQQVLDADAARIRRALRRLDEDDRELLTLIGWDELTPAQAAEVLGIRAGALRARLHRARARLRAALDG